MMVYLGILLFMAACSIGASQVSAQGGDPLFAFVPDGTASMDKATVLL
jgi:hypothetical protein